MACATLGIERINSPPGHPASRGKIERFFRTMRDELPTPHRRVQSPPGGLGRHDLQRPQTQSHRPVPSGPLERERYSVEDAV
ncbi:transposase [bacterium]|nr:transposase [bacterium]